MPELNLSNKERYRPLRLMALNLTVEEAEDLKKQREENYQNLSSVMKQALRGTKWDLSIGLI